MIKYIVLFYLIRGKKVLIKRLETWKYEILDNVDIDLKCALEIGKTSGLSKYEDHFVFEIGETDKYKIIQYQADFSLQHGATTASGGCFLRVNKLDNSVVYLGRANSSPIIFNNYICCIYSSILCFINIENGNSNYFRDWTSKKEIRVCVGHYGSQDNIKMVYQVNDKCVALVERTGISNTGLDKNMIYYIVINEVNDNTVSKEYVYPDDDNYYEYGPEKASNSSMMCSKELAIIISDFTNEFLKSINNNVQLTYEHILFCWSFLFVIDRLLLETSPNETDHLLFWFTKIMEPNGKEVQKGVVRYVQDKIKYFFELIRPNLPITNENNDKNLFPSAIVLLAQICTDYYELNGYKVELEDALEAINKYCYTRRNTPKRPDIEPRKNGQANDVIDDIERINKLLQDGAINENEYSILKKHIIESLE